ncbi:MAG: copper chaperone PCu(A)C [Granulosicoccus sp.]
MKILTRNIMSSLIWVAALSSGAALAELPQISDARMIQPPPGAKVAAIYFNITNTGDDTLQLLDARSDVASKTELHLSKVENDVAMMVRQDRIDVEAGETLAFRHGSYHVMLMGLSTALEAGSTVDIALETSAGELLVSVPVISLDDAMPRKSMPAEKNSKKPMKHDHSMKHEMDKQ